MSDHPPQPGHNHPPAPTFAEMLSAAVVDTLIGEALDHEPPGIDGEPIKSIRVRNTELEGMCQRFLAAHPKINAEEAATIATAVLSTCQKFGGRIEAARKALKQPVWDAGVTIDKTFAKYGTQLIIRPLTGPIKDRRQKPYTLAEQVNALLTAHMDEVDRLAREAAAAETLRKQAEADMAERLATKGSGLVTMEDAARASEEADASRAIVNAPAAALSRSTGGDFGTASRKRVRTFTITNAALVPRQYCVPDDALIRAAIGKAGDPMAVIPGVVIQDVSDTNRR